MSGAALQNLAGSAEQQRRAQRRAVGLAEIEPDEVIRAGWMPRSENRLTLTPFFGHEDPSMYSTMPFPTNLMAEQHREEEHLKKLNYNHGLLRKRWERKHTREFSYYEFCRNEMEKVDKLKLPTLSLVNPFSSRMPPVITPLDQWMGDHCKDLFFIQADGTIEVIIRVRPMLEQRILSNPQIEMFYDDYPSSYLVFNRFKNTGFEEETDQDYQNVIIGTVHCSILATSLYSLNKPPANPGRVIVIKGVQDTTMNFRFDDYLEYHWVPEGVGEGFKP